ncbi:MAG: hypothetical protein HY602_00555, partial [Parcubacteria group bacterium]|nr:hypothetical protein [Parcubacteria group bacterium]
AFPIWCTRQEFHCSPPEAGALGNLAVRRTVLRHSEASIGRHRLAGGTMCGDKGFGSTGKI